jgi:hypothetical protein
MSYTIQIGTYAPKTDSFTLLFDCNDGQSLEVDAPSGLDVAPPGLDIFAAANPRLPGARVTSTQYGPRTVVLDLVAGPSASYASLAAIVTELSQLNGTIRAQRLMAQAGLGNAARLALKVQPPGAPAPLYADILAASCDVPDAGDTASWIRLVQEGITLELVCAPFLRGPRATLENGVFNPGFEAGGSFVGFAETFANQSAYTWRYAELVAAQAALYYRLDQASGNFVPTTGTGSLTASGSGITYGAAGALVGDADTAATFDGVNGTAQSGALTPASVSGTYTVEIWFKSGGTGKIWGGRGTTDGGSDCQITSTGVSCYMQDGAGHNQRADATFTWPGTAWIHFVAVYTPTTFAYYTNGSLAASGTFTSWTPLFFNTAASEYLNLGWNGQGADPKFAGTIDEFAVYTSALSAATISQHYQVGIGTYVGTATDDSYYPDTVQSYAPLRSFRLDEASGTTAYDAAQGQNGTTHGSPTQGATGLLTGDSDTAYSFASASSQYVSVPTTNLPTGNSPWTIAAWIKTPASFSAIMLIAAFGLDGTSHEEAQIYLDATGHAIAGTYGGDTTGFALAASTVYFIAGTWDGTTLTLYVNGVSKATATPAAMTIPASGTYCTIGASAAAAPTKFYNGTIDEVSIFGSALNATAIAALYTAGTTSPAANAASISLPVGAAALFGDANWKSIAGFQVCFRALAGADARFFLHYTDSNDQLYADLSGGTLTLSQRIGGTTHQLASVACVLANEAQYWIRLTQFPQFGAGGSAQAVLVQASVFANSGGQPGALIAQAGPVPTFDAVTALAGKAGVYAVSGGALGLALGATVTLFGPGSWYLGNAGTGLASAAHAASTYTGGPVASQRTAQVQAAPAGTLDAWLSTANTASPANAQANGYPAGPGVVMAAACVIQSSGLGSGCAQKLIGVECDVNGNVVRSTTLATLTGNQASWATLSGNWTTGASCAFVVLELRATDGTSGSANGIINWDNVQLWNQTANGSSMPYCELAFNGPAQLVVSGLQGDVPALADVAIGASASIAAGASLSCYLGRRAVAGWGAILTGSALVLSADGVHNLYVYDPTMLNGARAQFLSASANWTPFLGTMPAVDLAGAFHLLARAKVVDTPATGQYVQPLTYLAQAAWIQTATAGNILAGINGQTINPFTANTWQVIDAGLAQAPAGPLSALDDSTQLWTTIAFLNQVSTNEMDVDWMMLLPVDGELLALTLTNSVAGATIGGWIWLYADGFGEQQGVTALTWSLETSRQPNAAHAGGAAGTSNFAPTLNGVGDRVLRVDPGVSTVTPGGATNQGVNQFAGVLIDGNADLLPIVCQVSYSPLYLAVR